MTNLPNLPSQYYFIIWAKITDLIHPRKSFFLCSTGDEARSFLGDGGTKTPFRLKYLLRNKSKLGLNRAELDPLNVLQINEIRPVDTQALSCMYPKLS